MTEISIVIPVYNSQDSIFRLFETIDNSMHLSYELILVNDDSVDNSWENIKTLAADHSNVVGINFSKNYGQDNAIMAGLRVSKGEYVVIMDDDLQHSPSDIDAMVEACKSGYDVCYANFIEKKHRLWKNIGSYLNGKLSEVLLKKPKEIYLSPFKVIRRSVVLEIAKYSGPYPYIDGLILSVTRGFTYVDVEHHERMLGPSTYSLRKSISVSLRHATGFSILPLRVASITGFFFSFAGLVLSLVYMAYHFLYGSAIEGWTTIVCLQLILGGATLFSLGVIGEYVGRTYLSINSKPQYVIKSVIGGSESSSGQDSQGNL